MNLGATEENLRRALVASKYQAQEFVGQGGMASVWRGVMYGAAGFTRPVAIKRILPQLISNPEFVDMFVEEARVLSQLLHSNIVRFRAGSRARSRSPHQPRRGQGQAGLPGARAHVRRGALAAN